MEKVSVQRFSDIFNVLFLTYFSPRYIANIKKIYAGLYRTKKHFKLKFNCYYILKNILTYGTKYI